MTPHCPCCGAARSQKLLQSNQQYLPTDLFGCDECGALYLEPTYSAENLLEAQISFHEKWWRGSNANLLNQEIVSLSSVVKLIGKFISPSSDNLIVEVGAGRGTLIKALINAGYKAIGCEPAAELREIAQNQLHIDKSRISSKTATEFLIELKSRNTPPQAIIFWHVLEHILLPVDLLKQAKASLAHGGFIFAQLPLLYSNYVYPEHLYFSTPTSLRRLGELAGLSTLLIEVDHQNQFITAVWHDKQITEEKSAHFASASWHERLKLLDESCEYWHKLHELDARLLDERFTAIQTMDTMIRERDATIAAQRTLTDERLTVIQSMDTMIKERDATIAAQRTLADERLTVIQSMDTMIKERDAAIAAQRTLADERLTVIQSMDIILNKPAAKLLRKLKIL